MRRLGVAPKLRSDHGEAWEEFKESNGLKKCWKCGKVFAVWFVAVGSLIGTLVLGRESSRDSIKKDKREERFKSLTNQLAQVKPEYSRATNDLAYGKNRLSKIPESRVLSNQSAQRVFLLLKQAQPFEISIALQSDSDEARELAQQLALIFSRAGFNLIRSPWARPAILLQNDRFSIGVRVATKSPPNATLNAALMALFDELHQMPSISVNSNQPDEFIVVVGANPTSGRQSP